MYQKNPAKGTNVPDPLSSRYIEDYQLESVRRDYQVAKQKGKIPVKSGVPRLATDQGELVLPLDAGQARTDRDARDDPLCESERKLLKRIDKIFREPNTGDKKVISPTKR